MGFTLTHTCDSENWIENMMLASTFADIKSGNITPDFGPLRHRCEAIWEGLGHHLSLSLVGHLRGVWCSCGQDIPGPSQQCHPIHSFLDLGYFTSETDKCLLLCLYTNLEVLRLFDYFHIDRCPTCSCDNAVVPLASSVSTHIVNLSTYAARLYVQTVWALWLNCNQSRVSPTRVSPIFFSKSAGGWAAAPIDS